MVDNYYNPFQAVDVSVSIEFHKELEKYCGNRKRVDIYPFPRMIDFWFMAVCVAARLDIAPVDFEKKEKSNKKDTVKIIDGSIFTSDPWRIHYLMLLAIKVSGDINVVSDPRKMINIANGLAEAGYGKVVEMLTEGEADPIWNLSQSIQNTLKST